MVALETVIFAAIAIAEIVSALSIFFVRNLLHAALALTAVFAVTSLVFVFLGQPLLAIFQLFIMVGGVSVYLFVSVAALSASLFKHVRIPVLVAMFIVVFAVLSYPMLSLNFKPPASNALTPNLIQQMLTSGLGIFYIIMLLLFAATFGTIMLVKTMGAKR
ncbi:MAG: NADH-quinone oxidoreductase subunit J [Candidatus Marsarchaeota archaeon]|jgi:NADH-quinone oxidoreductase subunit J|nr:NADH-quinone oxidoreductase subunit J [Candidatus Marsarchaeota archaeon]